MSKKAAAGHCSGGETAMLKLYYATHIVLEEVGADYSTVRIDFARIEQRSSDYLKVNPKGRVRRS